MWGIQRSEAAGACNEDSGEMLENRIRRLVTIDDMQFDFMLGRAQLKHCFFLRECKRSFVEEKKLYMCFVDLEKTFDRVPKKVMEWALRKKG